MRDKRPVDELSIEELERILAIKKREARQQQMDQMRRSGRVVTPRTPPPRQPVEQGSADEPPPVIKVPISTTKTPNLAEMERLAMQEQGVIPVFEDELDPHQPTAADPVPPSTPRKPTEKSRERSVMDRILIGVEIAAVIGVVVIGVNMVQAIGKLEVETSTAQQMAEDIRRAGIPTIEPTPTLRLDRIVLPGGHTSPLDPGGAQFNYEEVPAIYRPLVQSEWMQPDIQRPPITRETAVAINIPRLNLDASIVQGVDWSALQQGVGQLPNNVNPGDVQGNVVLAAHNDIYGELFRYLDQLQPGDPFQIRTESQVYNYAVTEILIVNPNDVYVMEDRGGAVATLISCYPFQVNTQRLVVYAERVS